MQFNVKGDRPADIMICVMSRLLNDGETVFHGVSSHMPLIATLLAKHLHAPELYHLNIPGGVNPGSKKLQDYTSAGSELITSAPAMFSLQEVFDLSMRGKLDVAFLSGIQFDVHGRVNASVIGDYNRPKVRMPGGAGSAVLIPTAKRAIIWRTKHDIRTFVEKVDFVTTRGNIDRIVTPKCVFKYSDGKLIVESIHPGVSENDLRESTGFELEGSSWPETIMPTKQEMVALKLIDPMDYRNIEF